MPLNPQAVQIYLQGKQAEQAEAMGGNGGSPFGQEEEGEEEEGENVLPYQRKQIAGGSEEEGEEKEAVSKSLADLQRLTRKKEKAVRFVIE
jgi:hypothetical protein